MGARRRSPTPHDLVFNLLSASGTSPVGRSLPNVEHSTTPGEDELIPDEQVYGTVLAALGQTPSRVAAELVRVEKVRGRHLFIIVTEMNWALQAYEDVVRHLDDLQALDGLDEHVAGLIGRCREDVMLSVDAVVAGDLARVTDLGRDLMEIEFLIRDFISYPDNLREWAEASEGKRNDKFGFARLAARQEKERGLPHGHLLPERREYKAHSASTHPAPAGRPEPFAGDPQNFIVNAVTEILIHHTQRVVIALGIYLEQVGVRFEPLTTSAALEALGQAARQQREDVMAAAPEWLRIPRGPFHKSAPLFPQPLGPAPSQ